MVECRFFLRVWVRKGGTAYEAMRRIRISVHNDARSWSPTSLALEVTVLRLRAHIPTWYDYARYILWPWSHARRPKFAVDRGIEDKSEVSPIQTTSRSNPFLVLEIGRTSLQKGRR